MRWNGKTWKQDILGLSTALAIVFCVQATAAAKASTTPPSYDPGAFCDIMVGIVLGDAEYHAQCVAAEKRAYKRLPAALEAADAKLRKTCRKKADHTDGGSYWVLAKCLGVPLK